LKQSVLYCWNHWGQVIVWPVDIFQVERGKERKKEKSSKWNKGTSKIILIGASTLFGNDQQFVVEPKHLVDWYITSMTLLKAGRRTHCGLQAIYKTINMGLFATDNMVYNLSIHKVQHSIPVRNTKATRNTNKITMLYSKLLEETWFSGLQLAFMRALCNWSTL
jgi:hypothetical protein